MRKMKIIKKINKNLKIKVMTISLQFSKGSQLDQGLLLDKAGVILILMVIYLTQV